MTAPSFPEIRIRLQAFAKQWKQAERENADAKLFWARFYECFGIRPESTTIYEKAVDKIDGTRGFIDSFIPGLLIVEHKSKGKAFEKHYWFMKCKYFRHASPLQNVYINYKRASDVCTKTTGFLLVATAVFLSASFLDSDLTDSR